MWSSERSTVASGPKGLLIAVALLLLAIPACVARNGVEEAGRLRATADTTVAESLKAQLVDASSVFFPNGAHIGSGRVAGDGWRYHATGDSVRVTGVPADSVAMLMVLRSSVDPAKSVGVTFAAAVAAFFRSRARGHRGRRGNELLARLTRRSLTS